MDIPKTIHEIIRDVGVRSALKLGHIVLEVILYGSYAYGTPHSASDVNIMLMLDCQPEEIEQYRRPVAEIASDLSLEYDITVSIYAMSSVHFARYVGISALYQEIDQKGIHYSRPELGLEPYAEGNTHEQQPNDV